MSADQRCCVHVSSISLVVGALLIGLLLSSCGGESTSGKDSKRPRLRFPVEAQPVSTGVVTYVVNAVGSVEAFETVRITARVAGRVSAVSFQEGEQTTTDRILVEIEPERFRLALDAAKAQLAKSEAMLIDANGSLARRESVNRENPGLVREEDLQAARVRVATTIAERDLARSALKVAELDLADALVRSPVAGVLQTRPIQTGQYVQPGTELATLLRRDPLLLRCRIPQMDATRITTGHRLSFRVDETGTDYGAVITHLGAGADPTTRLVDLTAHVDDPQQAKLIPGSFARVTIAVQSQESVVVPAAAIRPSERGFLAYVVRGSDDDERAEERVLALGLRTADGQVEIRKGLKAGERLIVLGAEGLSDDARITVQRLPAPGAQAVTLPAATP
jgi:multidrug efflux system membrane fusion protein